MPILKSFESDPEMIDVFRKYPHGIWSLCELHDINLRGESPLTVAERELIAAYVSGVNACNYCFAAHQSIAEVYGVEAGVFEKIMDDPASAGVDSKLIPILAYVKKLTLSPSRMTVLDAEAVYAAGWSERALFDAVVVCALFNFMNRLVDGTGMVANDMVRQEFLERMGRHENDAETYRNFARIVGAERPV